MNYNKNFTINHLKTNSMKKSILVITLFSFIIGLGVTSCGSPSKDVNDAEEEVMDAQEDLEEAKKALEIDMAEYRQEILVKISDNDVKIQAHKDMIANEKGADKLKHQEEVIDLEARNAKLKIKLESYNGEGKDNWEMFKNELNKEINDLGIVLQKISSK